MENALTLASVTFNTFALEQKEEKEKGFDKWIKEGGLDQGINKDWEYTHIIWKRDEPKDKADWSAQLLDPGVAKIMGYFGVRAKHIDDKVSVDREEGIIEVTMKSELRTILPILYMNPKTGDPIEIYPVIAEGVGACTTKEKRFRVKWGNYNGRGLIADGGYNLQQLEYMKKDFLENDPGRIVHNDPDIRRTIFFMPDPDAQGALNNLYKMAAKRSEMDAVFAIPSVAQRFTQELDLKDKMSEEGNREPDVAPEPEPAPEPEKDWDETISGKVELKYRLTPDQQRKMCDKLIESSDGLYTTYKAALSILWKRLEKENKPEKEPVKQPEFTPADKVESAPEPKKKPKEKTPKTKPMDDTEHDIPDELLETANMMAAASGVSLKELSDKMTAMQEEAAGYLTTEAALNLAHSYFMGRQESSAEKSPKLHSVVSDDGVLQRKFDQKIYETESILEETAAGLGNVDITMNLEEGTIIVKPKKYLGDLWQEANEGLRGIGYGWTGEGKNRYWQHRLS